jgi:hypothetical protein
MKINGQRIQSPNMEIIVIPRGQSDSIVFKARAVLNYEEFDKLCPSPNPPKKIFPGGEVQYDVTNPEYSKALDAWVRSKTKWMIIESLKATQTLEWETIVANDPTTWGNFEKELIDSGLSTAEIARIIDGVLSACGLNQVKIEQATKDFLAGLEEMQNVQSSPIIVQQDTQSGEPVNA